MNHGNSVGADDLFQSIPYRINQTRLGIFAVQLLVDRADQMRQHFGVRLGRKLVIAVTDQLIF